MNEQETHLRTHMLPADKTGIALAAALLGTGEIVALPTETVYGLAADATNGIAVAKIYAAKGRPHFNPLIVHVRDANHAAEYADISDNAARLMTMFWPGPLTLVLPALSNTAIVSLVQAGLPTIALRAPAHPVMQAVLRTVGKALAAPSANSSGLTSPTTAAHVMASLNGHIPLVIDGGACEIGLESTIIGFEDNHPVLLRAGAITIEMIETVLGVLPKLPIDAAIIAPGQLSRHYAQTQPLRLNASYKNIDEFMIGFGAVKGDITLSASGDLEEAAANLFAALHIAGNSKAKVISVATIPETGVGIAMNDRLKRATLGA